MRTIEIEDDVYDHLLRNTASIGESASEILRRLLGLAGSIGAPAGISKGGTGRHSNAQPPVSTSVRETEISGCIQETGFQAQADVIARFLYILSYLYRQNANDFSKVLSLSGRKRKYFALSSQEIDVSGSSVFPRQIPGTPYWVVTNNDTPKKRRMLRDVMRLLGYSHLAIEEATKSLA